MTRREEALEYHRSGRPGKIAVVPTKPLTNQRDLALAYSPGVAEPCLEIKRDPEEAYTYTAKGNLVAVVTNGTAVLGLGNMGAIAGKPVMEGKGNLFKQFADIDVFDIEVGSENPDDVIKFCQLLEPTVGGVKREHILMCDRQGVIYKGRSGDMDAYKARFQTETKARTITEALVDADVFVGLSVAGAVSGDMIAKMAPRPIIFALANPVPE